MNWTGNASMIAWLKIMSDITATETTGYWTIIASQA